MTGPTEILVCTTCRPAGSSRDLPAQGQALFEAVENAVLRHDAAFVVRGVACMSGCSNACTVALQAAGKTTYFFGSLTADDDTAEQVLACAQLHARCADGQLARNDRPEKLRNGILVRLPPLLGHA